MVSYGISCVILPSLIGIVKVMKVITHYDLFAGIGGFSLALERVFYDREIRHVFVERDDFCRAVLQKHWPDGEYYEDIRDFNSDSSSEGLQRGKQKTERYDRQLDSEYGNKNQIFLTGGFPCQPFSGAGKRRGTEDDRYLWPEMLRSIQAIKPDWIIAENVAGLLSINGGLVFEQVCLDLENQGYEVQPFIIPACAKNAPHRRDRVWIVANSKELYCNGSNNNSKHLSSNQKQKFRDSNWTEFTWNTDWYEVATKFCRVGDGLPKRLDRTPRLKALGNAIVPQIAEEIFKGIKEVIG